MPSVRSRLPIILLAAVALSSYVHSTAVTAQSEAVSRQSEASLAASVEVPAAALLALSEGAQFSVAAIHFSGEVAWITLSAAAEGSAMVVEVSAQLVRDLGLAAGAAVTASVVATGWIISVAGHALAYIADEAIRPLIHSRRISG